MQTGRRSPVAALSLVAALLSSAAWTTAAPSRPAVPDSWGPFPDRRIVSPSGRHYAVLRSHRGLQPGTFELVRRRDGAAPIAPASARPRLVDDGTGKKKRVRDDVARDAQDPLLVTGQLPQLPMDAAVVDEPLGIVLFDQYARVGYGRTLYFVDGAGELTWSLTLEDLFGGEPRGTTHTVSSRWWSAAWGVDGALGIAWALSHGGELRAVELASGELRTLGAADVASLCSHGTDRDRVELLDAVLSRDDLDPKAFLPALLPVAVDPDEPLATRLRAAVLCRRAGDRVDHGELFRAAVAADDLDVATFAALHLSEIADGEDALAPLFALLERLEEPLDPRVELGQMVDPARRTPGFVAAFRRAGDGGLARLRQFLDADDVPPGARISAGVIWWQLGQTGLPERLRALIRTGAETDANTALNALIYSAPRDLREIMLGLAADGTADDVRVAMYFKRHPHAEAVASLERMLGAPRSDEWERRTIREALAACRGQLP